MQGAYPQIVKFRIETYTNVKSYDSFLEYYKHIEKKKRISELKEYYSFQTSKWKYYTFWPVFIFGLIGGIYASFQIIKLLSTSETNKSEQTTIQQKELEQSTLHISPLVQKSQDSLKYPNPQPDSLKN